MIACVQLQSNIPHCQIAYIIAIYVKCTAQREKYINGHIKHKYTHTPVSLFNLSLLSAKCQYTKYQFSLSASHTLTKPTICIGDCVITANTASPQLSQSLGK